MGKTPQEPDPDATRGATKPRSAATSREARLKAALKANMARRKGQAAARRVPDAANDTKD